MGNPRYPTRDGVAISPEELDFPISHLNPENRGNYNNHHAEFYSRLFGGSALFSIFRNLEVNQYPMLLDTHALLHATFDAPQFPTPYQAMTAIQDEYDHLGSLRFGSQNRPHLVPLNGSIMDDVNRAYEALGGRQDKQIIDMGARWNYPTWLSL